MAVYLQNFTTTGNLTRDPATILGFPLYYGLLSNLGVLCWSSAATICLFSSKVVQHDELSRFLLFTGVIGSLLLFDDFFLFHERLFPEYLHIPEKLVYMGYVLLIGSYVVRCRKMLIETEFLILILAGGMFAVSVLVDLDPFTFWENTSYIIEDGAKLVGIVLWMTYCLRTSYQFVVKTIALPKL